MAPQTSTYLVFLTQGGEAGKRSKEIEFDTSSFQMLPAQTQPEILFSWLFY